MSRIQFLSSDLLNYHWVSLLNEGKELPLLKQSFTLKCCTIVTDTKNDNEDPELALSFSKYRVLFPFSTPKNQYIDCFLAALASQMLTNVVNHIVMNTTPHVIKFVRFKYQCDKQDAIFFINQSFSDVHPKLKEYSDFFDWCKFNPTYENNVANNLNHFVALSWEMLKYQEKLAIDKDGKYPKGRKTFSLAPLKADWIVSSILVNKTTMFNLLQQIGVEKRGELLRSLVCEEIFLSRWHNRL